MGILGPNVCLSGGADGSDLQWGMVAGTAKHTVLHFSFKGHKSQAPQSEIVLLDDSQLRDADPYCVATKSFVKRWFPPKSPYVANLLRRNWYQVRDAEACYAVSTFKNGDVQGGTAWAVAMFINKFNQDPCPAYVFDQDECHWYQWTGLWTPIYEPPVPTGIWAGIGTRDLNIGGKLAIRIALNWKHVRDKNDELWNTRRSSLAAIAILDAQRPVGYDCQ